VFPPFFIYWPVALLVPIYQSAHIKIDFHHFRQ
jgi:hypothetical protein